MNDKCENCKSCLFYRADADDIGTCEITDNIVDAGQDACNDYRDLESEVNIVASNNRHYK